MFEDLKDQIKQAEENHKLEVNESLDAQEAERKALRAKANPHPHNYAIMPYTTPDQLAHDVAFKYQTATNLFLLDDSIRDCNGAPFMVVRKLREFKISHIVTRVTNNRGVFLRNENERDVVDTSMVYAYISGDKAFLRTAQLKATENY